MGHVYNTSENSTSIKTMLATLGYGPKNNVEMSRPVLIPVVEGSNTLTATNANAIVYRNLPSCSRRISTSRDYLYKMTNFPNVSIATINGFINSAWYQNALDENPQRLTKVLSVLNFLAPHATSVERTFMTT